MIEVKRLKYAVFTDTSEMPADHKVLSTRFVCTWREKLSDTGEPISLSSRLVTREFAWMDSERDFLFSPASNAIVARLLPTMFLEMKENADCVMVSTDVKDAFLTLKQQALIHVDDMLVVGKRDFVMNRLVKCLKEKYEISVQTMETPGDEIQFLKRKMVLHHNGRLSIQTYYKHVQQMCALLGLNKRLQSKKTPGHSDMDLQDNTGELSPAFAKKFRTCVGILLYLASDLPHCQHIAAPGNLHCTADPKEPSRFEALVSYLACHEDVCISLKWRGRNVGFFHHYTEPGETILEVFTDSD